MGYYTQFTLKVRNKKNEPLPDAIERGVIAELREEEDYANHALQESGDTENETKWYDCVSDMLSFSARNPDYLFVLEGVGEEFPDVWRAYFLAGKGYKEYADIVYPEWNPAKLKQEVAT